MHLLVLDQTLILPWIVGRELPPHSGVEVWPVTRMRAAEDLLRTRPPDAAVISLPPGEMDWRPFHRLCSGHLPPIPILFESCIHRSASDLGLDPDDPHVIFLRKPARAHEQRSALLRLVELAGSPSAPRPRSDAAVAH